ncbi:hypothetical protein CU098_008560 [Rhizopus stolonifer]|uniref:TIGR02453 family protein n=1 Tax=Rhizopus stolonifer TaxID=4846 RepID=A0A367JHI1_RHIST|nr:hypothetical protein CU098_008560 [Rhizopus stolonifer]
MSEPELRSSANISKKKLNKKRAKIEGESNNEETNKKTKTVPKQKKRASKDKQNNTKRKKSKKEVSEEEESEYEQQQEESDYEDKKKSKAIQESNGESSDSETVNSNQINPVKIKIPRPKGSPFADSLSPDTLQFLAELAENNEREFMLLKNKEFKEAKKDFTDFCGLIMGELAQIDPTIRVEDAKNAVYRQNRDLRFSNDKRPYKQNLSASFSRTGRKFLDAGYFLSIRPGNHSIIAAGIWQPDKDRLARMRSSIIRNGDLLRESLSTDALKEVFDGKFGIDILETEDKLKVAPKNIAKDHPEIELLRFRSFAIQKKFTDEEVVSEGFAEKVLDFLEASVPFVAVVNSWV